MDPADEIQGERKRLAAELTVNDLDEGSLLERIFPRLGLARVPVGPGDDAAVIEAPDARTVISIDTLVQDQDFRLEWPSGYRTTGYDVGWKSVAQNLSDINAMGAVPTSLVISLTHATGVAPGRVSCAQTWRPYASLVVYLLVLGIAVRFIHHALFEGTMFSAQYYIVDTIVLLVLGSLGFRYTRTNQMVTQYSWLYERASLLSWKPKT